MSETVTIRLDGSVVALLRERADAMGVAPATLAGRFVGEGLSGPPPEPPGDGEVVASVLAAYDGMEGTKAALHRQVALSLARQVESGGTAAHGAGQRLVAMLEEAASTDEMRQVLAVLATPMFTHCQACWDPFDPDTGASTGGPRNAAPIGGVK